mmetsp:Transcript_5695/g.35428  ORF Transcript_5695/g.35428 Transcript_5695/m.35428 type:complete len:293 (+) Transcript_5695:944-1822(+)
MHQTQSPRHGPPGTSIAKEVCVVGDGYVSVGFVLALVFSPRIHSEARCGRCRTWCLCAGPTVPCSAHIWHCDGCRSRCLFKDSAVHCAADFFHAQAPTADLPGTSAGPLGARGRLFPEHHWFAGSTGACGWLIRLGNRFLGRFHLGCIFRVHFLLFFHHHGQVLRIFVVLDGFCDGSHRIPRILSFFGQHGTVALGGSGRIFLCDFSTFVVAPTVLGEVSGGSGVSTGRHEDRELFFRPRVEVGGLDLRNVHAQASMDPAAIHADEDAVRHGRPPRVRRTAIEAPAVLWTRM